MNTRATIVPRSLADGHRAIHGAPPTVRLLGLGTALPELSWPQERVRDVMAEAWDLRGRALDRWRRIAGNAGIDRRRGVLPVDRVWGLTTGERMAAYERHAPPLAATAARGALRQAGIAACEVSDLVIVTCTGFAAPGLDVALVERLGLRDDVRRVTVGFMGCYGAIPGLRTAIGACAADPTAVTLVVCCELCSLHVRPAPDIDNQVATALFGDGAAAAVVVGSQVSVDRARRRGGASASVLGQLERGATRLLPQGKAWMTWRITDSGFAMTLDRQVPAAIGQAVHSFIEESSPLTPSTLVVHPGGPGVLDAVESALEVPMAGLEASRAVLREIGNVSSGTVLFVLERMLNAGGPLPCLLLAFGPGLTMEGLPVAPAAPAAR